MRGVSGEEDFAELHGLHDEASHARDSLLQDWAFGEGEFVSGEANLEFLPDFGVGPMSNVFIRLALNVEPADLRGAHAEQSEAAFVIGVDQLVGGWGSFGENSEPAERIFAIVDGERGCGNRRPADTVEAVAPGNEVAVEGTRIAIFFEADLRVRRGARTVKIVDAGVRNLKIYWRTGIEASLGEIFDDFMLGVNGDAFTGGEVREIDMVRAAVESEIDAMVDEADLVKARTEAEAVHQVDSSLLEHSGADALFDVLAAAILDDDGIDAFALK